MESLGLVKPGTRGWPKQLDDLGDSAPGELRCIGFGELRLLALRSVAIVGCRAASAYGRAIASDLAAGLVERGWVVVSGAAFGIDAAAHRGALAAGGCTVAILPGGADVPVPRAHQQLLSSIAESGLVVSEHEFGVEPRKHMFLIRNRLIAAMTRGVVVVEADSRSGSINTATHAERLGRMVMATPGPITGRQSRGTHELIRNRRAELVTGPDDVVELLDPLGSPATGGGETEISTAATGALLRHLGMEALSVAELAASVNMTQTRTLAGLELLRAQGAVDLTIDGWRRSMSRNR
jgi:DNA processing protein